MLTANEGVTLRVTIIYWIARNKPGNDGLGDNGESQSVTLFERPKATEKKARHAGLLVLSGFAGLLCGEAAGCYLKPQLTFQQNGIVIRIAVFTDEVQIKAVAEFPLDAYEGDWGQSRNYWGFGPGFSDF